MPDLDVGQNRPVDMPRKESWRKVWYQERYVKLQADSLVIAREVSLGKGQSVSAHQERRRQNLSAWKKVGAWFSGSTGELQGDKQK